MELNVFADYRDIWIIAIYHFVSFDANAYLYRANKDRRICLYAAIVQTILHLRDYASIDTIKVKVPYNAWTLIILLLWEFLSRLGF